jgi:linoleoyl-CoA desaturase
MTSIKFPGNQSAFYTDLKARVNAYFEKNKLSKHGNTYLLIKSALFLAIFCTVYAVLVFITPAAWLSILLCIILGITASAIGFNIMHDGGHGSLSSNKFINRLAALTLNMLGGSSFLWNIKHNQLHHTFTNVEGHDDDIENEPFIRMQSSQKAYWFQRFQHIYWVVIYGLMYLAWVLYLDFVKYFRRRIGSRENISMTWQQHLGFWFTKMAFIGIFIVLPLFFMSTGHFITGFMIFTFTTGLIISVIFQLAHGVEGPEFINPESEKTLQYDWATHQVKTTANFATKNPVITFFTGGLNFQIEHHLFPQISHVHYPKLSRIVRETCRDHGLKYHEWPTMRQAVVSHIRFLKKMGR